MATARISQPDVAFLSSAAASELLATQQVSPEGTQFFIVTRRPNIASNTNIFELVVFHLGDVTAVIKSANAGTVTGNVLVRIESTDVSRYNGAIRSARWIDASTIGFLGEFGDGPAQAFAISTTTGTVTQLTKDSSAVLSFGYAPSTGRIVYTVRVPPDKSHLSQDSYPVGATAHTRLLFPHDIRQQRMIYAYRTALALEPERNSPLGVPFEQQTPAPQIPLAVSGRYIVLKVPLVSNRERSRWIERYDSLRHALERYSATDVDPRGWYTTPAVAGIRKLVAYDLATGESRSVFDAPHGDAGVPPEASWQYLPPSGNSVVIANTYLPIDDSGSSRKGEKDVPAVIEYWPHTGDYRVISEIEGAFGGIEAVPDRRDAFAITVSGKTRMYRRSAQGGWVLVPADVARKRVAGFRNRISIAQSVDRAADVVYEGPTGRRFMLTDLNPHLRQLNLGEMSRYSWRDRSGREWNGGLLVPGTTERQARTQL